MTDMGEELREGCIVWADDAGDEWCMDVCGAYNVPGTVSRLVGGQWVVARVDGWDDGCIYWEDEEGMSWCRDEGGTHGPPGGQYWSDDGGATWKGDGEAWLELADEAREYFTACEGTRQRRRAAAAAAPGRKAKQWENRLGVWAIPHAGGRGGRHIAVSGGGDAEAAVGGEGNAKGLAGGEEERMRVVMYGRGGLAKVSAAEAGLNARFDAMNRGGAGGGGKGRRIMWPELPLRM